MIAHLRLLLMVLLCAVATNNYAQCIPDLSITANGIYPDSATGLPPGEQGVPYSEVIQLKVLTDTSLGTAPIIVSNVTIVSVNGLPPGITYSCNPSTCIFPGGSNGCILLSGTPTMAGLFNLNVSLMVNGTLFGAPISQPSAVNYYSILIVPPTGLAYTPESLKFDLLQNKPNPATNYTDITFTSPIAGIFNMKIYNLIGKEVYFQTLKGFAGLNASRIATDKFTPGVYMISIENGNSILTRRMIVSRK